jgi:group I intron endonuclease
VTIYLIQNKINGKKYIGKTTRDDVRERWREHKKDANGTTKSALRHNHKPLYRAFRKYGESNFEFSIIEDLIISDTELAQKETKYINEHNSLSPNGYNLEIISTVKTYCEKTAAKASNSQQGLKKIKSRSEYVGVWIVRGKAWSAISHRKREYKKRFETEEDAARAYDRVALYLFGNSAKTNFDKIDYANEDLGEFFKFFIKKKQRDSEYAGVEKRKNKKKCWLCRYKGKRRCFYSEKEAAMGYDILLILNGEKQTNFKNKKYTSEEIAEFKRSEGRIYHTSKYRGVCWAKNDNIWLCYYNKKIYGRFKKEEDAAREYDRIMLLNNKSKVNFI